MGFLNKLFSRRKPTETFPPMDLRGRNRITLLCPRCKTQSDMYLGDPRCIWHMQRDDVGKLIPAECPYCRIGMLVCVRDEKIINIEPFGDAPHELLSALEKTIAKVTGK